MPTNYVLDTECYKCIAWLLAAKGAAKLSPRWINDYNEVICKIFEKVKKRTVDLTTVSEIACFLWSYMLVIWLNCYEINYLYILLLNSAPALFLSKGPSLRIHC